MTSQLQRFHNMNDDENRLNHFIKHFYQILVKFIIGIFFVDQSIQILVYIKCKVI